MYNKISRPIMAVVVVSALILAVSGLSIASNMGFKLNKALVFAGGGHIGDNWTSLPFNNPYCGGAAPFACSPVGSCCAGQVCAQLGLTGTGTSRATIQTLNETTGAFAQGTCGAATANSQTLIPGKGISIRQPNVVGAPTSAIIVGSHNPNLSLTIPVAGGGNIGNFWFSVPYHTTAVTAQDLCNQIGMTSTGALRGIAVRLNATTGAFTQASCGTPGAGALNLVLGEQIQLRHPTVAKTFIPAHF
jgi:hypothetical protein